MKVSLNSIAGLNKRYNCADDIRGIGIPALIEKIGAQLGAVEEIIEFGKRYQGIIVAKVISCQKHSGADKLSVCLIDDGGTVKSAPRDDNGYIQVVCGAPNVRPGLLVAWLPPGSTVPESVGKQPFVLKAKDLRGVVSQGMLASPKELALGVNHEGLLEIDADVAPGTDFAEAFELKDDVVLDIENKMFTHRPDCFGFLGIARELAGIEGLPFKSPDWFTLQPEFPKLDGNELRLTVRNEIPKLVPRFTMIVIRDVTVGTSPVWLQVELAKVGQKSINNIVDYTNFFMLETGQPLHAYDYDKVAKLSGSDGPAIVVRNPKPSEKVKLLNGKTITPHPEAITIATDKTLIGVGGAMGGTDTEVDEQTTNIILECGNFDMYSVRRTSMLHGLFTDAVTRFTKGQSPLQNLAVLGRITTEITQYAGGKIASPLIDDNHLSEVVLSRGSLYMPVTVSASFINQRLGLDLPPQAIKTLLEHVEFRVAIDGDKLTVTMPFWRTDIELREDIVEEVGRLFGYDKLLLQLPSRTIEPITKNSLLETKAELRGLLKQAGANELLCYSFVHVDLLQKVGQSSQQAYQLSNALSPQLQYYRLSLTPSLLEKVHPNLKVGYKEFSLFELGRAHQIGVVDDEGVPQDYQRLALVIAADHKTSTSQTAGPAYYRAKRYLMAALQGYGLADSVRFEALPEQSEPSTVYYDRGRGAQVMLGDKVLGWIGEFKPSVQMALKLPKYCAGFEIDIGLLLADRQPRGYRLLPNYPKVAQDITLKVAVDKTYQEVYEHLLEAIEPFRPPRSLTQLSPIDIYQAGDDTTHRNLTFRLTVASYERTLTDDEINKLLTACAAKLKTEINADRV